MKQHGRHRMGRWLPHQEALEDWLEGLTKEVRPKSAGAKLHPAVEEFRELISGDPIVRLLITQMIEQVPHTKPYTRRHLESVDHMLLLIDEVIRRAPEYNETGFVGVPLHAVIDWCMATPAGFAAFRNDSVNAAFRRILKAWCEFLCSPESLYVINDSPRGWKCASARKTTGIEQFQYKPREKHWGFASWNDYFTRRFKPGRRPIAAPDDEKVIINACESTPYALKTNVKREDRFWIKEQPYSLQDMLAGDESADQFVGGSVYQAYLDAHNYHRWHSPISGTIKKAFVREGTYYSETEPEGQNPDGMKLSQGYLAHVATRAIILIEADDPAIGLACLMPVGMVEVSSCVIHPEIRPGHRVQKGEEVGYFQYGGSTYCLIFQPGAIASFTPESLPQSANPDPPLVLLGTQIATAI
jgi:phosphatidylserine decarboxylase